MLINRELQIANQGLTKLQILTLTMGEPFRLVKEELTSIPLQLVQDNIEFLSEKANF